MDRQAESQQKNMNEITLVATAAFGLEKVVKNELIDLGFENVKVSDGKLEFEATLRDIPKANLWLRSADRVLLKMGEFTALTFEELFEKTKALPWEYFITKDGKFDVNGKAVKSTLGSIRACQSIVKKAVVERLKEKYHKEWFEETGPEFAILISMLKDVATLTIDTSGSGLHKRGYREAGGEAPMKETLAAALVMLSFWDADRILIDPMCGSGTILIEAAMIARNIAPGLQREFASEKWPAINEEYWSESRLAARDVIIHDRKLQLFGYDIDAKNIEIGKSNAKIAGVGDDIRFENKDMKDLWIDQQYGIVISNPPYGVRMSDFRDINKIYIALNKMFRKKRGWSVYILTADELFPGYFKRAPPDRVRKLYNGNIKVNYYQYYGDRPAENPRLTNLDIRQGQEDRDAHG
ncbi:MAG: class I SAM-dependent RNA methyltransferase [Dehalococcoidales bacterium]|nr:class I SAM-dependent RNA methyltransferase [Dehalococcoidales bacterium]